MIQNEKMYAYWLCNLPGIGNRTIEKLSTQIGTAKQIYEATENELAYILNKKQLEDLKESKEKWNPEEEYDRLKEKGIQFVCLEDAEYPQRLREIPDAPFGIFYKGTLPEDTVPSVAVIGSRDCSGYGSYVAEELGKYLGEHGVQVISGMARGIDGISQEAAIGAGGISFGVLGSGVDICYPSSNRKLYEQLIQQGGVLSAYVPGTLPVPQNFPPRNRIVSGLADALVVVEARSKSGTLITVDMALEQGKEVYVVPGRVTDRLSDGCNNLLKQGAGVFLSPEEFVKELKEFGADCGRENKSRGTQIDMPFKETKHLTPELRIIYEQLDLLPRTISEIQKNLPAFLSTTQVTTALMRLCMEGYATQVSPGQFMLPH